MRVRVITPPEPIVTPAAIAGDHAAEDATVAAQIQAVTEDIDGPTGWLGRALGPQTLELSIDCWGSGIVRLPYRPIIGVVSITYADAEGVDQTVEAASYSLTDDLLWFRPTWSAPAVASQPSPIRIRYKAGYNGTTGAAEGDQQTGAIPERARQAIILAVQHLRSLGSENLFLRSIEVPDVITKSYTVSDQASGIIQRATDSLLQGLRIFSL